MSTYTHRHSKGFNLVEAAIVLGVVGLVIGGIWVAASAVSRQNTINQAVNGLLQMAETYRLAYKGFGETAIGNGSQSIYPTLITDPPAGFTKLPNGQLVDPWGKAIDVYTYRDGGGMIGASIGFNLFNQSKDTCIKMATALSRSPSFMQLGVGYSYNNAPVSIDTANSVCTQPTNAAYSFYIWEH